MARAKKAIDPLKQAEACEMLQRCKAKFKQSLLDLQMAKRNFSTRYVEKVVNQLEEVISQNTMNMKAIDFLRFLKMPLKQYFSAEENKVWAHFSRPTNTKRFFNSFESPTSVPVQIPSFITPQFKGCVLRSRAIRRGEILFSVNGTPVIPEITSPLPKIVEQLLQKSETDLSPATRNIMKQFKVMLDRDLSAEKERNQSIKTNLSNHLPSGSREDSCLL